MKHFKPGGNQNYDLSEILSHIFGDKNNISETDFYVQPFGVFVKNIFSKMSINRFFVLIIERRLVCSKIDEFPNKKIRHDVTKSN